MGSSSSSRASPLPNNQTPYQNILSRYPRNDRFAARTGRSVSGAFDPKPTWISEAPSLVIRTSIASQGGWLRAGMPYAGFTARAATKPSPPRDWCCTRRASCRRTDGAGERPQSASEAGLCRRVRAMADGPQLRQIHLASSRQQGPGLGPLAGVGSAAGSGGRRFDAVSATRRTALPVLQSRPSSERHGRHAPHPLRRCRTGDSFLAQILREDFNATGDAGDATLNLGNTGDRP